MLRRFWKKAEAVASENGYGIALDGKQLKTPAGRDVVCPTRALAEAVAAEWEAAPEKLDPQSMPMTQLVMTALDIVGPGRADVVAQIAAYAATDMLCYRAAEETLAAKQHEIWQPYLDWSAAVFGASLRVTAGVAPIAQDEAACAALRRVVESLDDFRLTALQSAVTASGSLILGLALAHGWRDADDILTAAELDAMHQAEAWGEDEDIRARQENIKTELLAAARFLRLLS